MRAFRQVLFWLHLSAGLVAGVVIFVMCVTGALLAFERQTIQWSESDVRYVTVRNEPKLGPAEVLAKVVEANPDAKLASIAIKNEPGATWEISFGRDGVVFADPYTGAIIGESNKKVRSVMSTLREWHRYLALSGDQRPVGKAITGAANLLFLFLTISGIYIWFPRNLIWKAVRPVIWLRGGQRGKARNFNWHNTIGFWTSLLLIVFTLTATVISYRWASDLLFTLTGNEVPEQGQRQQQPPREEAFVIPANLDRMWAKAEVQAPNWKSIALRLPANESAVFTIDEGIYWNIFGRSTLTSDPGTAEIQKWEPYGERNAAMQLRSWFRFTHTGETGGIPGQILGLIACIGGAFLVWTGFSLAFRRFRSWLQRRRNGVDALS